MGHFSGDPNKVREAVAREIGKIPQAEALEKFRKDGVWCAAVQSGYEVPETPTGTQARAIGVLRDVPGVPWKTLVAAPLDVAVGQQEVEKVAPNSPGIGTRGPYGPAPRLGEHTTEVLKEAGMSEEELASLIRSGAAK